MRFLSLFTGAMGMDMGLEQAGMTPVAMVESDSHCLSTIAENRPGITVIRNVTEVHGRDFRYVDLVVGGPPCQAFSMAGRRLGFDDSRGLLVLEFGRVVMEARPRFAVMENVRGLASAKLDGKRGGVLQLVLRNLENIDYRVVHGIVDSVDHGVPQFRERLIIIASRDHEDVFLPAPTHFGRHQEASMRWRTLREGLAPGVPAEPCTKFTESRLKWLRKVPPGGNWRSLSEDDARHAMGTAFESEGGRTGYYRRLAWNEPCPTLVTLPTQQSTMLCHPDEDRPLSIPEYAMLQQFPVDMHVSGPTRQVYKQIGNAVPVGLGRAIGLALASTASGEALVHRRRRK